MTYGVDYITIEDEILNKIELEDRIYMLEKFVATLNDFEKFVYQYRILEGYSLYDVASMGWNDSIVRIARTEKRVYIKLKRHFGK